MTSHLGHCKYLYFGLGQSSLRCLQAVQNAAAHLLTGKEKGLGALRSRVVKAGKPHARQ